MKSIEVVIMVVLGGMGSLTGSILGAIFRRCPCVLRSRARSGSSLLAPPDRAHDRRGPRASWAESLRREPGAALSLQKLSVVFGGLKAVCGRGYDLAAGFWRADRAQRGGEDHRLQTPITGGLPSDLRRDYLGASYPGRATNVIASRGVARTFPRIRASSEA